MHETLNTIKSLLNVESIVNTFGYAGLFVVVFAETGLMLGFFFPGDSLLLTAGLLASRNILNIWLTCIVLFIAAVLGNITGYTFGKQIGRKLFNRNDSLFFHKSHLESAETFYEKHGGKTIIIARFMPIIRTFAPIVAGVGSMKFLPFFIFSTIGALLWAVGLTLLGYFLGGFIPSSYFELLVLVIVIASVAPGLYHAFKTKQQRQQFFLLLKRLLVK